MRPHEWIKNLVVLAGPLFGLKFLEPEVPIAFFAFCFAASACYVINDITDREADRSHPSKRHRPIASGAVSPGAAVVFAIILLAIALAGTWFFLPVAVTIVVASYFGIVLAYSLALKHRPILDVIIIATGFVLRAIGGAAAVAIHVSPWLIVCTFTLCMFLGFGKRRCELATLTNKEDALAHRSTLVRYTPELLNHLTSVSAGIAIVTFLIYTMDVSPDIPHPPFRKEYLLYTLPLVAYAVFRYAMLIESGKFSGPTQIFLTDRGLILTGLAWAIAAAAIVATTRYSPPPKPTPDTTVIARPITPSSGTEP
jgi:decaprenyl-phosphate phosphoribosyltransferase